MPRSHNFGKDAGLGEHGTDGVWQGALLVGNLNECSFFVRVMRSQFSLSLLRYLLSDRIRARTAVRQCTDMGILHARRLPDTPTLTTPQQTRSSDDVSQLPFVANTKFLETDALWAVVRAERCRRCRRKCELIPRPPSNYPTGQFAGRGK